MYLILVKYQLNSRLIVSTENPYVGQMKYVTIFEGNFKLTVSVGSAMAQAVSRRPPTAEARGRSMWDLWWTKWQWDRLFPQSISFLR
jgi:hypothetical protein